MRPTGSAVRNATQAKIIISGARRCLARRRAACKAPRRCTSTAEGPGPGKFVLSSLFREEVKSASGSSASAVITRQLCSSCEMTGFTGCQRGVFGYISETRLADAVTRRLPLCLAGHLGRVCGFLGCSQVRQGFPLSPSPLRLGWSHKEGSAGDAHRAASSRMLEESIPAPSSELPAAGGLRGAQVGT